MAPPRARPNRSTPGEVVELDVEIWPTSIVVPAGYRVGLSVRGTDYEFEGADEAAELSHFKGSKMRGVGIYTHADPVHRPADDLRRHHHRARRTRPPVDVAPPGDPRAKELVSDRCSVDAVFRRRIE